MITAKRRARRAIGSAAGALLLIAASASAAAAAGPDHSQCRMMTAQYGATCFQWVGDNQWVLDSDENGWATVVHVQTNYGKDRYCQALPAAGGWDYCSYDHREGKCVRFRLYEAKGNDTQGETGWSPWYGTEYGSPC